jgi:hypothetical protein
VNDQKIFFKKYKQAPILYAALLLTMTGCVRYVDGPRGGYYEEPSVVVQDDYVYYPDYQVYYSISRHQYAYRNGWRWVSRPAPRGVAINVLQASPSVRMNFHDSPSHHHSAVVKQYPRNWKPSGAQPGPGRNAEPRDQRGDNR